MKALKVIKTKEKTIDCPPNMAGLFAYAETIVTTELPEDRGRAFVLEMLKYGKLAYLKNEKKEESEVAA
jgi:hypothetical protein